MVVIVFAAACSRPGTNAGTSDRTSRVWSVIQALRAAVEAAVKDPEPTVVLPKGLSLGEPCTDLGASAHADIERQASATIPLIKGLTLSHIWTRAGDGPFEHECLTQVDAIDTASIQITASCTWPDHPPNPGTRRICRSDLDRAPFYVNTYSEGHDITVGGTTMFSLPVVSFAALTQSGTTPHHYVELGRMAPPRIDGEFTGALTRAGHGTMRVIVNAQTIDLPVVQASGILDGSLNDHMPRTVHATASVLDDDRFPLLLDYGFTDVAYSIRYTKITFPAQREMEKRLSEEEPVDVYGIYFDFASDRIRPESTPILDEIAAVLAKHPTWRLSIRGHTDSIGGIAANRLLSERRAAAVRQTLIDRYMVGGERLETGGYGAAQPKDTNKTIEGRARNRRVELSRIAG